ncbi:RNA polymerase factor sigma-54 [Luxibacter massiliensis]|uniref:RNA polymerase factor sigma-54 n=1 Tax=Luxibacter massiliensis TaxID=2219695 RepID=UPI0013DEF625|nr:RNA polymerase factor sigma-54 [Luxibacter massiliensis]
MIEYDLKQQQRQYLSQTQIQSLELMGMCNMELSIFLNNEYLENPILEQYGGGEAPGATEELGDWYSRNQNDNEGYGHGDYAEGRHGGFVPADREPGIEEYLKEQLDGRHYSPLEWHVMEFLIKNLDDNGFYSTSVKETAGLIGAPREVVQKCLSHLQKLEPSGIFAKDLSSCLIRQLETMDIKDTALTQILSEHLEDIAQGRISAITRHIGISSVMARKYIAFIRTLNPRPLSGFYSGNTSYIIPDVLAEKKNNQWEIRLNDHWMGKYQLNEYYLKMLNESKDKDLKEYFGKKLERARFILKSIEQRRNTIYAVAGEILESQKDFFEGIGELKSYSMAEVARRLDIHPSTVSRAVKGKYIQYPGGVLPMKDLYLQGGRQEGETCGRTAAQMKKILKAVIDGEDKGHPYSDSRLSKELKEQGILLSRRGVAKYREELGIKGSFERKEYP